MNPWRIDAIELARRVVRTCFWGCLMAVALMGGWFLVRFAYSFFNHLSGWCERRLFGSPW